jgi:hypothetical protein
VLVVASVAGLAGCAAATPSRATASRAVSVAAPAASPSRRAHSGPLTRADVEALVAGGLGAFLARIEVSPVMSRGRFVGFRLDAAQDLADWRAAGADIRLGDIVLRINGVRIERPEQAMWAFERLRIVSAIEVELLRDGAPVTVRYPIVDGATTSPRP